MPLTPEGVPDEALAYSATHRLGDGVGSGVPHLHRVRHAGLAVSGGGDSMAMLHLVAPWALANGIAVSAATVDHGLRPEAAEEARVVEGVCQGLGLPHRTLRWAGWDGRGNLQQAAREARRSLLAAWAAEVGADAILLGHTSDDVVETFLLRLARGSGVDGLAPLQEDWRERGVRWLRPMTSLCREDLRAYLRRHGHAWIEDPSNDDPRFDRVRARAMMGALADLGLTSERLWRTASHLGAARRTLAREARRVAEAEVREDGDALLIPRAMLRVLGAEDTPGRLLAAALQWIGGRPHRPRYDALLRLAALLRADRPATLAGCKVTPEGDWVRIAPEGRHPVAPRAPGERFAASGRFG